MKTSIAFYQTLLLIFATLCLLTSCASLEREIELDLPEYEKKLAVECYLKPGKPYKMGVTESVDYFSEPDLPIITDATAFLTVGTDTINFVLNPILFDVEENKLYNYITNKITPLNYEDTFKLWVADANGREVVAATKMLPPVPIDTIEWSFNQDSSALIIVKFQDEPDTENFYRFMVEILNPKSKPDEEEDDEETQSQIRQDFFLDDDLLDGEQIPLGTGFEFEKGDTLAVTLYHIEKAYYNFFESVDDAVSANFNPFGQPTSIKSNVENGTGIFTFLIADRDTIVIQ